jgi:hypothetical protein
MGNTAYLIAWGGTLGCAALTALVTALLAWLLQLRKPARHPALTALLASLLLAVIAIIGVGFVVVRMLIAIGAAGHADIDQTAGVASLFINGVMVLMLIPVAGFPAAWIAALRTRRRPG